MSGKAKNVVLGWAAFLATSLSLVALIVLTVKLWPPGPVVGGLLAAIFILPVIAAIANIARQQRSVRSAYVSAKDILELSDDELQKLQLEALAEIESNLELRELRLARRIRAANIATADYLDLLDPEPTDKELEVLLEHDRRLILLIEEESQLAFDRILANRYASGDGVDTGLIMSDVRDFVEKVAQLYQPESENILLETEIERMAKSLSSTSLHLLLVIDGLPLDIKSYNLATVYRLIRRGVSYYGTYKAFRPYLEHGMNSLQLARLAMGINPLAVGTAWLAGKLASHGAKAVGERLLQRTALQLLNDFIRVIGFESAMMYGGGFQHRDANWVFGAALVNLEICREGDFSGRDAAIKRLCSLVLRNEFDRVRLLSHLAQHKRIDFAKGSPRAVLTQKERDSIADELASHCRDTRVDLEHPSLQQWRQDTEVQLSADPGTVTRQSSRKRLPKLGRWFGRRN